MYWGGGGEAVHRTQGSIWSELWSWLGLDTWTKYMLAFLIFVFHYIFHVGLLLLQ